MHNRIRTTRPNTIRRAQPLKRPPSHPPHLCTATALSAGLVTISDSLSIWLDFSGGRYIILTSPHTDCCHRTSPPSIWCAGGFELGVMLSFVFFASIAAGADIGAMIRVAPLLVAFVAVLLSSHLLCLLVVGRWLRLSLPELLTASNAAVLGATTAPAMAAAKGWHDQ